VHSRDRHVREHRPQASLGLGERAGRAPPDVEPTFHGTARAIALAAGRRSDKRLGRDRARARIPADRPKHWWLLSPGDGLITCSGRAALSVKGLRTPSRFWTDTESEGGFRPHDVDMHLTADNLVPPWRLNAVSAPELPAI
jgi:hypothetical protein